MLVKSVKYFTWGKQYKLENGTVFDTHRFCCLGERDDCEVHKDKVFVNCLNGRAIVMPSYLAEDHIKIGTRIITLVVKEPTNNDELSGYHKLEEYHYRGKILHGRRIPLVMVSNDPLLPSVLGYIELTTAFIVNKPRTVLFDHPFTDDTGTISWENWKKDTMTRYTNVVVRIARCVISPEFRGLGLAGLLVKHAIIYAKNNWQIAKLKPLFLEITADMLRYVPFVESAGMHYIGETEGNLNRVKKDMRYILSNYDRVKKGEILDEQSAGIIDLQVQYATHLKRVEEEQGISKDDILNLLMLSPNKLSDDNWELLHSILRFPKPTFIIGLTKKADEFIMDRKKQLNIPEKYPVYQPVKVDSGLSIPIKINNSSLHVGSSLIHTNNTRKVQQAFGINRDMLRTTLFSNLTFTVNSGDIVLLCGPSGAGKTTLLNLLKQRLTNPDIIPQNCDGFIEVPSDASIQILEPPRNSHPLVNSISRYSFEHNLYALNLSGLAEAHLYVKRFCELSNGQRYRAMVAKLIASGANIWIADEFCATLDPITANIVARNIRRYAKCHGTTVIVAAANWIEFIHELKPDTTLHLRSPWDYRIFNWNEFQSAISESKALGLDGR